MGEINIEKVKKKNNCIKKLVWIYIRKVITIEPIFCVRQLIKKYKENKNSLWMLYIDLEIAWCRVPRGIVVFWKKGISVVYVKITQDMYEMRTSVKDVCRWTEDCIMKVSVMDEQTKSVQNEAPRWWCLLMMWF